MDRSNLAAAFALAAIASLVQSLEASVPVAAAPAISTAANARLLLPADFLGADLPPVMEANEEADRMAREVVDILLRDGREMLAG